MKRSAAWIICLGLIAATYLVMVPGLVAEEMEGDLCVPLGVITLEPPEGVEARRAAVDFPHGQHFSIACNECHHKWEGTDQFLGCMTSGCHDQIQTPKKGTESKTPRYYKTAYHKSCIGCHKLIKEGNEKLAASGAILEDQLPATGPTGCVQCHPKDE